MGVGREGGEGSASLVSSVLDVASLGGVLRAVSFAANLALSRRLPPSALGVGLVHFGAFQGVFLFVGREGFRRGCLRSQVSGGRDEVRAVARLMAVARLEVPFAAAVVALGAAAVFVALGGGASTSTSTVDGGAVRGAWAVFVGGVLLEIVGEPLQILAHNLMRFRLRAAVECGALLARTAASLLAFSRAHGQTHVDAVYAFAWGQVGYGATFLCAYALYFLAIDRAYGVSTLLGLSEGGGEDDGRVRDSAEGREMMAMTRGHTWQAVQKAVLTQAENAVLVGFAPSLGEQGTYGLVSSLGSLVVRFLFAPVEDVCFTYFSKQGKPGSGGAPLENLAMVVRGMALVGLAGASFAPGYAVVAIRVLYGRAWALETEAPALLGVYGGYVLCLAVLGVAEAYAQATASAADLRSRSRALGLLAAAGTAMQVLGVRRRGARGLVAANCAVAISRAGYAVACAGHGAPGGAAGLALRCVPSTPTLTAFLASLLLTTWSRDHVLEVGAGGGGGDLAWDRAAAHVALGAACLGGVAATVALAERPWIRQLRAAADARPKSD